MTRTARSRSRRGTYTFELGAALFAAIALIYTYAKKTSEAPTHEVLRLSILAGNITPETLTVQEIKDDDQTTYQVLVVHPDGGKTGPRVLTEDEYSNQISGIEPQLKDLKSTVEAHPQNCDQGEILFAGRGELAAFESKLCFDLGEGDKTAQKAQADAIMDRFAALAGEKRELTDQPPLVR